MSSLLRSRVAFALLVIVAITGSACAETSRTGIALQNVDADIVFGVKPVDDTAAPANSTGPTASLAELGPPEVGLDQLAFDDKPQLKRLPPITSKPPEPCPSASTTDFAPVEAPLNATGTPAIGLYRWKYAGTQELTSLPGFKLPVNGFEKRLIRNFEEISATEFRFDMAQPELGQPQIVVTTYKVKTAATSSRVSVTDTRTGEPDRGVAIEKIVRYDTKTGNETARFTPSPAVLVLPLPVVPGEKFQSVGIDPTSLDVLQMNGTVSKRQQVDACGSMVDGWQIDLDETSYKQGNPTTLTYQLIIATQLGAIPIAEHVKTTNATGTVDVQFNIGQTKPDPLPDEAAKP